MRTFLILLNNVFGLHMMFAMDGWLAIAKNLQLQARVLFGYNDPKLLEQPLVYIDDTPPNNSLKA
jgi:hypothetical protein